MIPIPGRRYYCRIAHTTYDETCIALVVGAKEAVFRSDIGSIWPSRYDQILAEVPSTNPPPPVMVTPSSEPPPMVRRRGPFSSYWNDVKSLFR